MNREKDCLVSVVAPLHNDARVVVSFVQELHAQLAARYENFEMILVDDGSTDNTRQVIDTLLAQVEWLHRPGGGPDWTGCGKAGQEASACLLSSGLAEVWTKPADVGALVWRERAFEVVLDGVWISGVFDRVVIWLDPKQRPARAVVYDFKTDRNVATDLSIAAERHSEQIELYRQVLAVLTGLGVDKIGAEVVFTGLGRKVRVGKHS